MKAYHFNLKNIDDFKKYTNMFEIFDFSATVSDDGFCTYAYTFLCQGYIIEASVKICTLVFPAPVFITRVLLFIIGFTLLCLATAVYFNADQGVSAYDAISIMMTGRLGFKKFRYNRVLTDVICLISGCLIYLFSGGILSKITSFTGIGTILIAIFMGPAVDVFRNLINDSSKCIPHVQRSSTTELIKPL